MIPGPQQFDNLRVTTPFVLHKDDKYYMFYTGMSTDGKWQIGLATSDSPGFVPDTPTPGQVTITVSPTSTPSPSPTLELTSTPTPPITISPTITPTPTPSYTPTPTIDPKTAPIILIPGMGASWNSHALYSCNLSESNSSTWKMTPFVSIYQRLINTLSKNAKLKLNQDLFIYNYDWRQPLDTQADILKNYLDSIIKSSSSVKKFRLIGHSLGGLVIRSYLERYNTDNNVIQALTIGTPHQGTLLAYPLWENGEIWSGDLTGKIALSQILEICKLKKTDLRGSFKTGSVSYPSKKDLIRSLIPSIQSLLPTFDYLYQNGKAKKTDSLTHQNDWLPKNLFPENHYQIKFDTLSGTGQSTLSNFIVSNPQPSDLAKDIWADGKPIQQNLVKDGDGTVLTSSSQLDGAGNETVSENHLKIVSSKEAIQKILHFLQYDNIKVAGEVDLPEISSDNAMVISTDLNTHIILSDLSGKVLGEADNVLVRFNPRVGVYKFTIIPAVSGETVLDTMFIGQSHKYLNALEKIRLDKNVKKTYLVSYLGKNMDSIRIIPFR
ncbi:alpha/beta hydrolase [Candidatus Gottesmanbacteria bacterium]|nr:alpha/beta hydrolase [Candidatus Gottesmanbacteria bacterium]